MTHPTELRGKVALCTGGSSGIGRAITQRLLGLGMNVATCARRKPALDSLPRPTDGGALLPIRCDLRDPGDIAAMFTHIREHWGGVDVLINNAGLGRRAPLLEGATEDWQEMLDVNVLALCICTREAVRDMRARGDTGHVVHISSMAGHRIPQEGGVYAATKHAVTALTEGLRRELRALDSAIRISAVSPGFVRTEFATVYEHGDATAAAAAYDRYAVLEPSDIAETVAFILQAPPHMQVHDLWVRPTAQPD